MRWQGKGDHARVKPFRVGEAPVYLLKDSSRRLLRRPQLVEDVEVFSKKTVYNIPQKSVLEWTKIWCLGLGPISQKRNRDPEMCDPDVFSGRQG